MAFTEVDLPIQEMLQTHFITDLAPIHNSNVLLLKDKLEDIINNFEIDPNSLSIGTDNAINSIKSSNVVIQDGGLIFQTGVPNQIIARLEKNIDDQSVLSVNNLNVSNNTSLDSISVNELVANTSVQFDGATTLNGSVQYTGQMVESFENIDAALEYDGSSTANATITLTNTSRRNIYVTLKADTQGGAFAPVYAGGAINSNIANFILNVDFDENNPPVAGYTFTIHIVDVQEDNANTSIVGQININSLPLLIAAGTNNANASNIILHYDLVAEGQVLGINYASTAIASPVLLPYGANATFNYVIDRNSADRLIVTGSTLMEIY
jgi:hypothetical protein